MADSGKLSNAALPTVLKKAATGVFMPKLEGSME